MVQNMGIGHLTGHLVKEHGGRMADRKNPRVGFLFKHLCRYPDTVWEGQKKPDKANSEKRERKLVKQPRLDQSQWKNSTVLLSSVKVDRSPNRPKPRLFRPER